MKNAQIAVPKGATKTDLRLTRQPADTPRGRLHRLAAVGVRAEQAARRTLELDKGDVVMLRALARRAYKIARGAAVGSVGALVVEHLCWGLDQALEFLAATADVDVAALCDGLTRSLVQLEVAEGTIRDLQKELDGAEEDLRSARADVRQLRTLLASANDQAARKEAAEKEAVGDDWREATRRRELTEFEKRVIGDPDA